MFKMPTNGNTYNTIFPYPLDKEEIEYLQKGVQSILKEMCHMGSFSWDSQYYTPSSITTSYNQATQLDLTLNEHNYVESENYDSNLRCHLGEQRNHVVFPKSQCHISENLYRDILNNGINNEDIDFLRKSFYLLLWDAKESHWTRRLKWIAHPTTADITDQPDYFEVTKSPVNKSGCARTEGYSKKRVNKFGNMQGKNKQQEMERNEDSRFLPYSKTYKGNKQPLSRDARNDQRRLSTAYQTITHSNLLNLNELKFRKKKLKLGKSEIHGLGLFASEPIGPNEIIIEYVGQIIRPIIADLRENGYKQSGLGYYCFLIDDSTVIDATKYGNINRYINHSCNPNSYAKILIINNKKKIVIYSKRHITVGEEITYDYKMKYEDEKIECLCKAPGCRKSLN